MKPRGLTRDFLPLALGFCLLARPFCLGEEARLYPSGGINATSVKQGAIGSCYFHASIAAIAQSNPGSIQKMIQENTDRSYTVTFPDGRKETAYPEDLTFARKSGYENSEGLWVVVLFRAYAQRVLRETLVSLIDASSLLPILKPATKEFVTSYDFPLLAYDRAIRTLVDQRGHIDRAKLVARLKEEMRPYVKYEQLAEPLIGLLDSGGNFEMLAGKIRQNGELFGAYRAVGQGGLPDRVLEAFLGQRALPLESKTERSRILTVLARMPKQPVIATTGDAFADLVAGGSLSSPDQSWYLKTHAFTVMAFDAAREEVIVRNPWAAHPEPDGVFVLPLQKMLTAFPSVVTVDVDSAPQDRRD